MDNLTINQVKILRLLNNNELSRTELINKLNLSNQSLLNAINSFDNNLVIINKKEKNSKGRKEHIYSADITNNKLKEALKL